MKELLIENQLIHYVSSAYHIKIGKGYRKVFNNFYKQLRPRKVKSLLSTIEIVVADD